MDKHEADISLLGHPTGAIRRETDISMKPLFIHVELSICLFVRRCAICVYVCTYVRMCTCVYRK